MNDPQLIDRLAVTDLYRDGVSLPDSMRSEVVLLDIARRMDMDTMERVEVVKPPRRMRNGALIAAAAFGLVIVVGLATVLLSSRNPEVDPAAPPTTVAPPEVELDASAADPIQARNDQASRVIVNFSGNAKALAEGTPHQFEVEVSLEGTREDNPGATVMYRNNEGVITTTGSSPGGAEMTATWDWYADDGLLVTLRGQGIGIPDTRPEVVVRVQTTETSEIFEFVMDTPAG